MNLKETFPGLTQEDLKIILKHLNDDDWKKDNALFHYTRKNWINIINCTPGVGHYFVDDDFSLVFRANNILDLLDDEVQQGVYVSFCMFM